jgi:hypothetical protein
MAATKQRLSYEQKLFIVDRLARRRTPSQVAREVLAEFGIVVSKQHVESYDPTKTQGRKLTKKWADYFTTTRQKYDATAAVRVARWSGPDDAGASQPGRRPLNA